jgi:hypothetical protein
MNKQQLLNRFVKACNGKGQSVNRSGNCMYVRKDHPGCGIGCQPQFQKVAEKFPSLKSVIDTIDTLIETNSKRGLALQKAFNMPKDEDAFYMATSFLMSLQDLHDRFEHWDGVKLRLSSIKQFCKDWKLTVPKSKYAQN